jgi:hypothetical protein
LQSLTSVVLASGGKGFLTVSCDLKDKNFIFGVMSSEYGSPYSQESEIPNNFRYRIDKKPFVMSTMSNFFPGVATTSKIDAKVVADILKGGKRLIVQTTINEQGKFVSEFSLNGAAKVLLEIIGKCK